MLIPGAGGAGLVYWSRVAPLLAERGHEAVPVEIAGDDPALGLPEYAAIVEQAMAGRDGIVLVAQSMGGFTAPMVDPRRLSRIVLLNAMIPMPGETPGGWFADVGVEAAQREMRSAEGLPAELTMEELFLHDIDDATLAAIADGDREPAATPFGQPCSFEQWPDLPTHVLAGADDRLFPLALQRRLAAERLGLDVAVVPGGHLAALSHPDELARALLGLLGQPAADGEGSTVPSQVRR